MSALKLWLLRKISFPSNSILRRSLFLHCFILPATLLNLAALYAASVILDTAGFGVFYVAITAVNVIFAPAPVFNLFYARAVVMASAQYGEAAALYAMRQYSFRIVGYGAPVAIVAVAALWPFALVLKVSSSVLALVIVIAYTAYAADTIRWTLQGLQRFVRFGIYNLLWMAIRFLSAVAGLVLFRTAWGGLLGIAVSGSIAFCVGMVLLTLKMPKARLNAELRFDSPGRVLPLAISYAIYTAATFADIALVYLTADKPELGIYSASSALPKGTLLLTLPIIQVAFPLMIQQRVEGGRNITVLLKGVIVTLLIGGTALGVIWFSSGYTCTSAVGLQGCNPDLLTYSILGVLPLLALRVLIVSELSRGRDWHPTLLLIPLILYGLYCLLRRPDLLALAQSFGIFGCASLAVYALIYFSPDLTAFRPNNSGSLRS